MGIREVDALLCGAMSYERELVTWLERPQCDEIRRRLALPAPFEGTLTLRLDTAALKWPLPCASVFISHVRSEPVELEHFPIVGELRVRRGRQTIYAATFRGWHWRFSTNEIVRLDGKDGDAPRFLLGDELLRPGDSGRDVLEYLEEMRVLDAVLRLPPKNVPDAVLLGIAERSGVYDTATNARRAELARLLRAVDPAKRGVASDALLAIEKRLPNLGPTSGTTRIIIDAPKSLVEVWVNGRRAWRSGEPPKFDVPAPMRGPSMLWLVYRQYAAGMGGYFYPRREIDAVLEPGGRFLVDHDPP